MHGTEEASNDGKVRVCIIHGLNISHKELKYLLQKSISYRNYSNTYCKNLLVIERKYYAHAPRGIDW